MSWITLQDAQLAFGHVALLSHAQFSLERDERVGLIGRNGTGKSSLLKILAGLEHIDDGSLQYQQGLRLAYVAQEPVLAPEHTIFESVSEGLAHVRSSHPALRSRLATDRVRGLLARTGRSRT
jgi:ATP-binding cassette subfamily F protein uup